MPGSPTTPGRTSTCDGAPGRVAFRYRTASAPGSEVHFAAQWLACTHPCQRFAAHLAMRCA